MAIYIHIAPGTMQTGLWCDACQLPSVYVIPLNVLHVDGVSTMSTITRCTECQPLRPRDLPQIFGPIEDDLP